jgi:hypothetical protein
MFNLYLAQNLAQVRITDATAKPGAGGQFEVTMTVTNEGGIPTALEIAKRVKIVREDAVSIQLSPGQTFVGGGGRGQGLGRGGRGGGRGGGREGAAAAGPRASEQIGWLKPGETRTVSWSVTGTGAVTLAIESTRGGVDRRTLALR